jgi:hypothetical protein
MTRSMGPDMFDMDITDEELTALALSADPEVPLDPDARPAQFIKDNGLLPTWYMPAPLTAATTSLGRGRITLTWLLIAAFLTITALGSCVTYGQLRP